MIVPAIVLIILAGVLWLALKHEQSLLVTFFAALLLLMAVIRFSGIPVLGFFVSLGGLLWFLGLSCVAALVAYGIRGLWRRDLNGEESCRRRRHKHENACTTLEGGQIMDAFKVFLIGLIVFLSAIPIGASVRDVSIYGIVERVVLEPNENAPERIKIWGVFALLYVNQQPVTPGRIVGDTPYTPHRGYLYFKLPVSGQEAAKKEWRDLEAVAGTGQAISFGSWSSGFLGLPANADSLPFPQRTNGFVSAKAPTESLRVHTEAEGGVEPITYTMDTGIVQLRSGGSHSVLVQS